MSKSFEASSTFTDSKQQGKGEVRVFELTDLLSSTSKESRSFVYDSKTARNFDQSNVGKAKEGVKELMADAIAKAKTLAIEIKDKARKQGYKEGYDAGFKKGEDAAKAEFSPFLETIHNLIRELSGFRKMMYSKAEREMIEMVVDMAKKVLRHELSTREDSVQQMILLAMSAVLDKENMTIRINPSDKGYAEAFRPELHHLFGEIKNITFEAQSGIERGGCIIESNFGTVDARISQVDEQIDKILNLTPALPVPEESAEPSSEKPAESGPEKSAKPSTGEPAESVPEGSAKPSTGEPAESVPEESLDSALEDFSESDFEDLPESTEGDGVPPDAE
ncbi:MAG: hypothetical protein IID18_03480 [Nitrospinae bacterium]|nr:hypothetical protein [Nitrospinota bacterium]